MEIDETMMGVKVRVKATGKVGEVITINLDEDAHGEVEVAFNDDPETEIHAQDDLDPATYMLVTSREMSTTRQVANCTVCGHTFDFGEVHVHLHYHRPDSTEELEASVHFHCEAPLLDPPMKYGDAEYQKRYPYWH